MKLPRIKQSPSEVKKRLDLIEKRLSDVEATTRELVADYKQADDVLSPRRTIQ